MRHSRLMFMNGRCRPVPGPPREPHGPGARSFDWSRSPWPGPPFGTADSGYHAGVRERGAQVARAPLQQADPARIGRYRLVARLGAGGMGVVYLAEARDGQPVAVKVLRPELADNPEFRTRFGREVTTLTRVQGMCTVRVIEADTQAPKPFLVTEYADGPSLAEYVDAPRPARSPDAVRPGHRARRGADRDPRGRDRAPGPQALQRAAHRGAARRSSTSASPRRWTRPA